MRIKNRPSNVPAIHKILLKLSCVMPAATIPVMEAIILGAIKLTAVNASVPKIDNNSHHRYRTASFARRHNVFMMLSDNMLCFKTGQRQVKQMFIISEKDSV